MAVERWDRLHDLIFLMGNRIREGRYVGLPEEKFTGLHSRQVIALLDLVLELIESGDVDKKEKS